MLSGASFDSYSPMSESILRYTDLAHAIQLARSSGMGTTEIVRALTGGMSYADALKFARRAAPLLGLSTSELMRLRSNR